MDKLYNEFRDKEDGFLYIRYGKNSSFG